MVEGTITKDGSERPFSTEGNKPSLSAARISREEIQLILSVARKELLVLTEQRSSVMKRIASVRRTIVALTDMLETSPGLKEQGGLRNKARKAMRQGGLTDACRMILRRSQCELTATEVVEKIQVSSPALFRNHKNPTSSVATILRRLESYGEAAPRVNRFGRRAWIVRTSARERDAS